MNDFNINIILDALSLIALLGGGFIVVRNKASKENIKQQGELISTLTAINATYKQEIIELKASHIANTKAIAHLEGQIKTLKEVPLHRIMGGIEMIERTNQSIAETQAKIVDLIKEERTK